VEVHVLEQTLEGNLLRSRRRTSQANELADLPRP